MSYELPIQIKKTITFPRLASKNVECYEVYGRFIDKTYTSGLRNELLETIINPQIASPIEFEIDLPFSDTYTYKLPEDIYMDKDHKIFVYINDMLISNLWYTINNYLKLLTINSNKIEINQETKIKLRYYKDLIEKDYYLDEDCTLFVKPIFVKDYHYGDHNVIL